jgi:hypothetical protein
MTASPRFPLRYQRHLGSCDRPPEAGQLPGPTGIARTGVVYSGPMERSGAWGKFVRLAAGLALLLLLGCLLITLIKTRSWPLISDAALMRYANFLLHHGMAPYRQLVDINLPGSYLLDSIVTATFGPSAAGWRAFDLSLLALTLFATAAVAIRGGAGWYSGCFAGCLFALLHIADGVAQAGQRDLVVAVLLLVGSLALCLPASLSLLLRALLFGFCCGVASTIKPQALLFCFAAVPVLFTRQNPQQQPRSTAWAFVLVACGALAPIAGMSLWLLQQGALAAFLHTAAGLMRYHAGMARHSAPFLLEHAFPSSLLPLLLPALALLFRRSSWRFRAQQLALAGIAFGLLSFILQGKAYPYHRYPLLLFTLLLIALELGPALLLSIRGNKAPFERACVLITLAYAALWLAPSFTARALRYDWRSQPSLVQLQADLTQLGMRAPLSGNVQCMDTMAGCITVLNRMQLVQSTGFLYDCYFFAPGSSAVKDEQRRRFLNQIERRPPQVFVITDQWCLNLPLGYQKLQQWPAFLQFLNANYTLSRQRAWSGFDKRTYATWPFGYRIYTHQATGPRD